jgi:outer membrane receptor protein involved in Fe transport
VQIGLGPNVSKTDLVTTAGFVDDTWRIKSRLTLSLGLRLDRYQPGSRRRRDRPGKCSAQWLPFSRSTTGAHAPA